MQCLTLALENPAHKGEYRVFNQFQEVFDITQLALKVQKVAADLGLHVEVRNLENPRYESEDHYYNADHQQLFDLGYQPTQPIEAEIKVMLEDLLPYRDRILQKKNSLIPDIRWDGTRSKANFLREVSKVA